MFFVLSRAWDKEKILNPHEESNHSPSDSALRCSITVPQRLYRERGLLRSSYDTRPVNVDSVLYSHIPTNSVASFSAYKLTHNPQYLQSLWRWANARIRNVNLLTLYGGQFTFLTQLLTLNYLKQLQPTCSRTLLPLRWNGGEATSTQTWHWSCSVTSLFCKKIYNDFLLVNPFCRYFRQFWFARFNNLFSY